MDADEKRAILAKHLADFRTWTYGTLAAAIDKTVKAHDCLRHTEGVFGDGTEYHLEFNVFWDKQRGGNIRVCADITTEPQRAMLGFIRHTLSRDGSGIP